MWLFWIDKKIGHVFALNYIPYGEFSRLTHALCGGCLILLYII